MNKTNKILKLVAILLCAAWVFGAVSVAPTVFAEPHVSVTVLCDNGRKITYDEGTTSAAAMCKAAGTTYTPANHKDHKCPDGKTVKVLTTTTDDEAKTLCTTPAEPSELCTESTVYNPLNSCEDADVKSCAFGTAPADSNCILVDIQAAIDFLAVGVGIIVTIVIIIGGIQYITSRDDPQAVQGAKNRITNALIALFLFLCMYAFLQWLVPGGIF